MEDEVSTGPNAKLLAQAKRHRKLAEAAWGNQRSRERDDLRFQVPEEQWTEEAKLARAGGWDGGVPVPARPMLSISRIAQPVQMVLNQERAAHLGVSIQPLSADAEQETAAILEGIYRRIERDSQAHIARSWAFKRGVDCGMGAYRVNTCYDDTSDDPMDQKIEIQRILHQEAVYFDPSATKPDFSDGNFAFVAEWMPIPDFKKQFPKAEVPEVDSEEWTSLLGNGGEEPKWVQGSGEDAAVLVVEYFYKIKSAKEYQSPSDPQKKRELEVVEVRRALLAGTGVLEDAKWNGKHIPLIPVIGNELLPFDEERRWSGMITDAKDPQRAYNMAFSSAIEIAALEPKAPWIGFAEQFEGYEKEWQQSNTRNFPILRHKVVRDTSTGQILPPPQRAQIDSNRLGVSMSLLQMADQGLQAATSTYDPALGRTSSRERSGRAIDALQKQGEEGNSHFMHNLADVSMNYEARVILDLIPVIYDRPGRIARTLSEEDKSDTVMLNARFVKGPDGRPVAAPEDGAPPAGPGPTPGAPMAPPGPGGPPGMHRMPDGSMMPDAQMPAPPPQPKTYDLRKGTYSVAISIGKTRQSALQEGAEEIQQILQAMPNLAPIILPTYMRFRDFPGAKELADLLTKVRDKQFPGLGDPKEGERPTVEQAMAKASALEEQMQQMGQQMEAMGKALETEQVKQQATMQKAQMEAEVNMAKAQLEAETKLRLAEADQQGKTELASIQAQLAEVLAAIKMGHQSKEAEADRDQEKLMKAVDIVVPPFTGPNEMPLEEEKEV